LNLNAKVLRNFVRSCEDFEPQKYTQDGIRVYLSIYLLSGDHYSL